MSRKSKKACSNSVRETLGETDEEVGQKAKGSENQKDRITETFKID